jgi:beta-glucosidase
LPLKACNIKSIAVIGDNATRTFALGGYGAGVKARYEVTALAGIKSRFGKTASISFAQGYKANYLASNSDEQNRGYDQPDQKLIDEAVALAKNSDVAILCIGSNREYESEAHDRKNLELPFGEQALVNAVTAANPNTIIVIMAGAPYNLNEIKKNNRAVVWSWFNGSEAGNALADVLKGVVNPSGKLPFTFPVSLHDSPAFNLDTYPGKGATAEYKEGILVGYRWYDTKKIEPEYPFGYGLSYTDFSISKLSTDKLSYKKDETIRVKFTIKNTGSRSGAEVVQLYVSDPVSSVLRPEKELKGFQKVFLQPGETKTVELDVKVADLAFYDETKKGWNTEAGEYILQLGNSSRNIIQKVKISVK